MIQQDVFARQLKADMAQYISQIRLHLRDNADLNRLVVGMETNNRIIAFHVLEVISEFNGYPPKLREYGFYDFRDNNWLPFLTKGVLRAILRSVANLQVRNRLTFTDGGTSIQTDDHAPELLMAAREYDADWRSWVEQTRISENIAGGFGCAGVSSIYGWVNGAFLYDL